MARYLAVQTNGDGRPCGWGIAGSPVTAFAEAERQWEAHGECYPGEERGKVLLANLDAEEDLRPVSRDEVKS